MPLGPLDRLHAVRADGSFGKRLAAVALAALVLRVAWAVHIRDYDVRGDAELFRSVAAGLADGRGLQWPPWSPRVTAEHPPLWEIVLAGADLVGLRASLTHRVLGALIGTFTVVLVGLIGRRVAGPRAGLLASALAALSPMLIAADASLMSETLFGALVAGALLAAIELRRQPSLALAASLGALIALAALTRGEGVLLLALLAVPATAMSHAPARRRLGLAGLAVATAAAVMTPWTVRNLTTFERPVVLSNNAGGVLAGANCPRTYRGELLGAWVFDCFAPAVRGDDESEFFHRQQVAGLRYARDHTGRLAAVVIAREARLFDVGRVGQALFFNALEGRPPSIMRWAIRWEYLLLILAVAGAVILARRRRTADLIALLAPVVLVVVTAMLLYGLTRFRHAAEPTFAVLAAVSLESAWRSWAARRAARTPA